MAQIAQEFSSHHYSTQRESRETSQKQGLNGPPGGWHRFVFIVFFSVFVFVVVATKLLFSLQGLQNSIRVTKQNKRFYVFWERQSRKNYICSYLRLILINLFALCLLEDWPLHTSE